MTYYNITEACKLLGISITADNEEIQKRWRIVARKYHPDLHPNDPDAKANYKKYRDAYEVINTHKAGTKVLAAIEDIVLNCEFDGWLDDLGVSDERREEIRRELKELGLED